MLCGCCCTEYVGPICLPPQGLNVGATVGSRNALVAGWGATEDGSPDSPTLQWVGVPFVDLETCKRHYKEELVTEMVSLRLGDSS